MFGLLTMQLWASIGESVWLGLVMGFTRRVRFVRVAYAIRGFNRQVRFVRLSYGLDLVSRTWWALLGVGPS